VLAFSLLKLSALRFWELYGVPSNLNPRRGRRREVALDMRVGPVSAFEDVSLEVSGRDSQVFHGCLGHEISFWPAEPDESELTTVARGH
jgi:hypothetical protein